MPPGGPPPKNKLPWIIGAILLVLVILVGAVLILAGGSDKSDDKPASTPGSPGASTSASQAPADSITYEITGSMKSSLSVGYMGDNDATVTATVSDLPWSVTISPAPSVASIFAISMDILGDDPDVTLKIKRGDTVLRECKIMDPCVTTT
ncbi:hypothetical protein AWC30_02275 [Mycolicibacillus trivialis]|uniref:MmpS family membrane protein n=2 Tax=Mycolicibacillus trivialis TaxID=1798 RepID=A0A1X2ERR0_9MYCO|nr:hypothetical protein AWC30_02275 [Mycolicibacillus trivialis]